MCSKKHCSKRGISPLIAVALLLGIAVSLAAFVMTWGDELTESFLKGQARSGIQQITCRTNVKLGHLKATCEKKADSEFDLTIKNDGNSPILGVKAIFKAKDKTETFEDVIFDTPIPAFGSRKITVNGNMIRNEVWEIDVHPILKNGNSMTACSDVRTFTGWIDNPKPICNCNGLISVYEDKEDKLTYETADTDVAVTGYLTDKYTPEYTLAQVDQISDLPDLPNSQQGLVLVSCSNLKSHYIKDPTTKSLTYTKTTDQ